MKKLLKENKTLTQIVYDAGCQPARPDVFFEKSG